MFSRKIPSVDEYIKGIMQGNVTLLSRAITLIESTLAEHQQKALDIVDACLPHSGKSIRIGITGVPGVGKSTFIETFGNYITSRQHKLAVLAVDPSSNISKGSILGDKTRMEKLSVNPNAFIRPSPSAGSLGGVARKTRESIVLCEAAGYDVILVETVGVGQSETAVQSMVDFFLLLLLTGAGDELQGIKRGIMEMADALLITKADGENSLKAKRAMAEYKAAIHLFPPSSSGWIPPVDKCSALTGEGMENTWEMIERYQRHSVSNGYFSKRRNDQSIYWMYDAIHESLHRTFFEHPSVNAALTRMKQEVVEQRINPYTAAQQLLHLFKP
jgi:LAO/AO transport system kinase